MAQIADQLAGIGKAQLDTLLKAAELTADSVSKLAEVNLEAAKESYADSVATLKKVGTVKDVNSLGSLNSGASFQPLWDKATSYSKAVYGVVSSAQAEYAHLVEQQLAEINKGVVVALDTAVKSAPPGSESVFNVLKSSVHSANAFYETLAKTARQVVAATEANLSAAANQVTTSAKKKAA